MLLLFVLVLVSNYRGFDIGGGGKGAHARHHRMVLQARTDEEASMWMAAAAALDTTSIQPTPGLSSFLSQRKLGSFVQVDFHLDSP
eukprot:COSAG05_NODE_124_length_17559_cov_8.898643_10_plen_86_part_00